MKKNKNSQTENEAYGNTVSQSAPVRKKKKKKWIPIVIVIAVVAIIIFQLVSCATAKPAGIMVTTSTAVRGDLQESVSTSGAIESEEAKVYFAPVDGTLGEVRVKAGDTVKKGDVMAGYDEEQIERIYKEAALQQTASKSTYQSAISDSSEKQAKLAEANTNLAVLDQQIKDYESYLQTLQDKLSQNQRDTINGLGEESLTLNNRMGEVQKQMESMDQASPEYASKAQELQELSAAQSRNSYLQSVANSNASDYAVKMQKEIDDVTKHLNECKEYKAKMEAQKDSSEAAVLDSYQKEKYNADKDMAALNFQKAEEDYYTAKKGITAEFDGVVTECTALEGSRVTAGTQLLTLENSSQVKVAFNASKHDLEKLAVGKKAKVTISGRDYEGEVSKINRMAAKNESGTPQVGVEVRILNPDDQIILGLDAKLEIYTNKTENALLVPVEALNADKDGDFLYTVENGVAVRKPVVSGISSDAFIEIKEGITESDQIIVTSYGNLSEGIAVMPMPGAPAAAAQ